MAWKDLNLVELKFSALVYQARMARQERQRAMSAGRTNEADGFFLEYTTKITRGEQLALELGYPDYETAAQNVLRKSGGWPNLTL